MFSASHGIGMDFCIEKFRKANEGKDETEENEQSSILPILMTAVNAGDKAQRLHVITSQYAR
jgi:hypothetical protein